METGNRASSGRLTHPSKNVFRWVFAGWLGFALIVALGSDYSIGASIAYVAVVALVLLPTLLIARTWVEATKSGLIIQNPYRRTKIDWQEIADLTIEWRFFTRIGCVHLTSGDHAWIHAIAGGNRLSRQMSREADEALVSLRSYAPNQ